MYNVVSVLSHDTKTHRPRSLVESSRLTIQTETAVRLFEKHLASSTLLETAFDFTKHFNLRCHSDKTQSFRYSPVFQHQYTFAETPWKKSHAFFHALLFPVGATLTGYSGLGRMILLHSWQGNQGSSRWLLMRYSTGCTEVPWQHSPWCLILATWLCFHKCATWSRCRPPVAAEASTNLWYYMRLHTSY